MEKQQTVEQFGDRSGVPHPHEFEHKFTDATPVAHVKCTCGYDGLAHVIDGKPVCPRETHLKNAQETSVQNDSGVPALQKDTVASIVAETLRQERARVAAEQAGK